MKNIRYINAGAGSGKTYSLTEMLADLIEAGKTTPSRVILTTFTDAAATEFRVKAREMLVSKGQHQAAAGLDSAVIGTVHSVALRYIKRYWYLLGLGANVRPMPEEEMAGYIEATLAEAATPEDLRVFYRYAEAMQLRISQTKRIDNDFWKEAVRDIINKAETFSVEDLTESRKESLRLLEALFRASDDDATFNLRKDVQERVFRIAEEWKEGFKQYKQQHDLVSFNDMERHFLRLLEMPVVREDIAQSVDYVFVDEFQDSSPTQVRIFDALSEIVEKGSIWVGDPKQAIYDFRGCDTELTTAVAGIIKKKAGTEGFSYGILEKSWRSDPALVDLVNKSFTKVFEHQLTEKEIQLEAVRKSVLPAKVPHVLHWELTGQNDGGKRLSYKKAYLQAAIASAVRDILKGKHAISSVYDKEKKEVRPLRPSDIAILCFTKADCDAVAARLRDLRIPVTRDMSVDAGHKEVALLVAALNYIVDDSSLLDAELSYLLEDTDVEAILEGKDALRSHPLFALLDGMRGALRGKPVSHVVDSVIAELDLESLAFKWGGGATRKYALESVKKQAADYEKRCLENSSAATLSGFINELTANPVTVKRDIQSGGVNVLTYHASKGLEWGIVILCSLGKNDIDEMTFLKREYLGVHESRACAPTEEKLYSDYQVRYIPRYQSSENMKLDDTVLRVLRSQPDRIDRLEHVRDEMARLLYVGATRARDYLITAANSGAGGGTKWFSAIGIDCKASHKMQEGYCQVWGDDAQDAYLEFIDVDTEPYMEEATEYSVLHPADNPVPKEPKFRNPSNLHLEEVVASARAEIIHDLEHRMDIRHPGLEDNAYGNCIHAIYAACRKGKTEQSRTVALRTLRSWGVEEQGAAEKVAASYEELCRFLTDRYGPAEREEHEVPFMHQDGAGHIYSGVMDLLWHTSAGTVIVDYKTFGGNRADALRESIQENSSQLHEYNASLKAAGRNVLATILFYPVTGVVIEVK